MALILTPNPPNLSEPLLWTVAELDDPNHRVSQVLVNQSDYHYLSSWMAESRDSIRSLSTATLPTNVAFGYDMSSLTSGNFIGFARSVELRSQDTGSRITITPQLLNASVPATQIDGSTVSVPTSLPSSVRQYEPITLPVNSREFNVSISFGSDAVWWTGTRSATAESDAATASASNTFQQFFVRWLTAGTKTITVTARNGNTQTYNITVTAARAAPTAPPPSPGTGGDVTAGNLAVTFTMNPVRAALFPGDGLQVEITPDLFPTQPRQNAGVNITTTGLPTGVTITSERIRWGRNDPGTEFETQRFGIRTTDATPTGAFNLTIQGTGSYTGRSLLYPVEVVARATARPSATAPTEAADPAARGPGHWKLAGEGEYFDFYMGSSELVQLLTTDFRVLTPALPVASPIGRRYDGQMLVGGNLRVDFLDCYFSGQALTDTNSYVSFLQLRIIDPQPTNDNQYLCRLERRVRGDLGSAQRRRTTPMFIADLRGSVTPSNIDPDTLFEPGTVTRPRIRTRQLPEWIARTDLNIIRIRDRARVNLNQPVLQDTQYAFQHTEIAQALSFRQEPGVRARYTADEAPHGNYDLQSVELQLKYRNATPRLPVVVVSSTPAPT